MPINLVRNSSFTTSSFGAWEIGVTGRMPNHVTNVLHASQTVLDGITVEKDGERHVDFNLLIPMPDENDPIFTATRTEIPGFGTSWGFGGGHSPLDWAVGNWGTKWNAYETDISLVSEGVFRIKFETAWSHPNRIMAAIKKRWPEENILVWWADEDFGYNLGKYRIAGGEYHDVYAPSGGSPEALQLASHIIYQQSYSEVKHMWDD